jgi:hypothetical protein
LPIEIEALLGQEPNENACRQRILSDLNSDPKLNPFGVPLIIQSVWYATVNISARSATALDASAKAKLDQELAPLKAEGSVSVQNATDSTLIASTEKIAFPVAWRPAFISASHYDYINQLMDQSWFRFLLYKVGLEKSDQQILEILRTEFRLDRSKIPRPKDIGAQAASGPAIKFDETNKMHLEYIRAVNALYGLSEAIQNENRTRG